MAEDEFSERDESSEEDEEGDADDFQAPPETEQEKIAFLRGNQVPDRDGTFGDVARKDGTVFQIEVFKKDGTSAGTATGETAAEVVASAQSLLDED